MPFRARLKKTFGRSSSPGGSSGDSSSADSKSKSGVYLPGEKIPQSKYRRPVAKEHKEKLEAFSFAHAWRRQSHTSTYSPMGSRMPSRKNSAEPQVGRRSRSFVQQVAEGDVDDTDLANVGLSRQHTADDRPLSSQKQEHGGIPLVSKDFAGPNAESSGVKAKKHDSPFSPDELTLAIQRSHLTVPS